MSWILEPMIGAIIGCITNYIAILMLFRPHKEIRIFGMKLPFTPGIIPKRKPQLAKVLGEVVEEHLLDTDSMVAAICNEQVADHIVDKIMMCEVNITEKQAGYVTEVIEAAVEKSDIDKIIAGEIQDYLKNKASLGFAAKLMGDKFLSEIAESIGGKIKFSFSGEDNKVIAKMIQKEADGITGLNVAQILQKYEMDTNVLEQGIKEKYCEVVAKNGRSLIDTIDVATIVENKVNEMSVQELEQLVLKVMKKELGAIVILGLVIGFVLGLINLMI